MKSAVGSFMVPSLHNGVTYYFMVISILERGLAQKTPQIIVTRPERSSLQPRQLSRLINDSDPDSVIFGEYYQKRRNIPLENIVHFNMSNMIQLSRAKFHPLEGSSRSDVA
ncbi:unnamed protein product [Rotaria sp. Silwood1]|nr:unnamed protein product [Rotaria sp. Silwood1]